MREFRAPNRTHDTVSQSYNDGVVKIYSVTDSAQDGSMPQRKLTLKCVLMYAEERVGITRYYTAQQYNDDVERLIRVQRTSINTRDIAETEDGRRYNIGMVQTVEDAYPPSLDLTLTRIK